MQWKWLQEKSTDRWIINIPSYVDKTKHEHDVPVSLKLLSMFKERGIKNDNSLIFPAPRKGGVRSDIESAFTNALIRCGLNNKGISPYALRRTRITLWDAIDSNSCRYACGHKPKDIHLRHYVKISHERLFKLVGLDFKPNLSLISAVA